MGVRNWFLIVRRRTGHPYNALMYECSNVINLACAHPRFGVDIHATIDIRLLDVLFAHVIGSIILFVLILSYYFPGLSQKFSPSVIN